MEPGQGDDQPEGTETGAIAHLSTVLGQGILIIYKIVNIDYVKCEINV